MAWRMRAGRVQRSACVRCVLRLGGVVACLLSGVLVERPRGVTGCVAPQRNRQRADSAVAVTREPKSQQATAVLLGGLA
eukprot:11472590-Alexandrium_andersonii.AAC.1